jgi:hypothetical protein
MRITTALAYFATTSLALIIASFIATQDVLVPGAVFAIALMALITVREYAPRNHFVVTARRTAPIRHNQALREIALRSFRRSQMSRQTAVSRQPAFTA